MALLTESLTERLNATNTYFWENKNMSAFVVDKLHIASILNWKLSHDKDSFFDTQMAVQWANKLMRKNVESVNYRYNENDTDIEEITTEDIIFKAKRLSAVQVLKAIKCLEYQSCEQENYFETEEHQFLERLLHAAISTLPGYDKADWEIHN